MEVGVAVKVLVPSIVFVTDAVSVIVLAGDDGVMVIAAPLPSTGTTE